MSIIFNHLNHWKMYLLNKTKNPTSSDIIAIKCNLYNISWHCWKSSRALIMVMMTYKLNAWLHFLTTCTILTPKSCHSNAFQWGYFTNMSSCVNLFITITFVAVLRVSCIHGEINIDQHEDSHIHSAIQDDLSKHHQGEPVKVTFKDPNLPREHYPYYFTQNPHEADICRNDEDCLYKVSHFLYYQCEKSLVDPEIFGNVYLYNPCVISLKEYNEIFYLHRLLS